ncbi:MAG TPA: zinc-ribbon domain-containing protein, partial [Methanobacterium sp.]|nr:zinc-ribbon domain-containing protein [Methanobacterium sp.]
MISCPKCGADNKENFNFCETCGERLKTDSNICPECGKENVEIAKFCDNCGTGLETSEMEMKSTQADMSENNSDETISLDLTPAESIVILNQKGNVSSTKNLLKVTLIDLIFKNVFTLDVQEVEKKGLLGSKMVKKIYLEEGKNFNMPLKPHEEVFRDNLPSKSDSKRLKKLQQRVFKKYRNNFVNKKLFEPMALEGYFDVEKKFLGK